MVVKKMIGYETWMPAAQVIAILFGYAIAGLAFFVYSRTNAQSMAVLGIGLASHATTFLTPLISNQWIEIPNILIINYGLLFGGFALIGYAIILVWKE